MRRLARLRSLIGLGIHRTAGQFRHGNRSRLLLCATGVAIAIGLMVVVTSTSLGLAAETTVYGSNVDYWIVPEQGSVSTMAVDVGGPKFGDVHPTADHIQSLEGVQTAVPVSMRVIDVTSQQVQDPEYILVIGTLGRDGLTVGGLPTDSLTPGDPHFANGSYDGPWTGDLVASSAAASILEVDESDTITPRGSDDSQAFTVKTISEGGLETGAGELPVVLVHLSELQAIEQTPPRDTADQFLVKTTNPDVRESLAGIYPESRVVQRNGVSAQSVAGSDLSLAMALSAFVVALVMGALFVATTLGLEITADRHQLATLAAIGYSDRSVAVLVGTQSVTVAIVGGLGGLLLGTGGILALNYGAAAAFGTTQVAIMHPALAIYGLLVATIIGLVSSPYLAWLARRTTTTDQLAV